MANLQVKIEHPYDRWRKRRSAIFSFAKSIEHGLVHTSRIAYMALFIGILVGTLPLGVRAELQLYFSQPDYTNSNLERPHMMTEHVVTAHESITIVFDAPVTGPAYSDLIELEPTHATTLAWSENNQKLHIYPSKPWKPQTKYTLSLPQNLSPASNKHVFSFVSTPLPKLSQIPQLPTLRTEKMLALELDRHAPDLDFHSSDNRVSIHYNHKERALYLELTDDSIKARELIDFSVLASRAGMKSPAEIGTFPLHLQSSAPLQWPEDHGARLLAAKELIAPKITRGKYVDVNLAAQVTTLYEDGKFVRNFIGSSGLPETPTPEGIFTIHNKARHTISQMFQVELPYWMAFTADGKYGFHDLPIIPPNHPDYPEFPEGARESTSVLGGKASPGCVRHNTEDSIALYEWTDVGTPIIIYNN